MNRIVFLVPTLNTGGAERFIINLANYFIRKGAEVSVLYLEEGKSFYTLDKRINCICIKTKKNFFISTKLRKLLRIIIIIKILRRIRPKTILSTMEAMNTIAPLAAIFIRPKPKVIVTEQNTYHRFASDHLSLRKRIALLELKISYRLASLIVANSQGTAGDIEKFLKLPSTSILVIGNPIFEKNINKKSMLDLPQRYRTKSEFILAGGRLHPQKDYKTLIKAFYLLPNNENLKLIILGSGPEEFSLKNFVKSLDLDGKVLFAGNQANPYVFMKNAKLLALSSKWEGFGNVIVESLAVGTPGQFVDTTGGPKEILKNGEFGQLVETGNAELFSQAIHKILVQEITYCKDSLINRAQKYSVDTVGEIYFKCAFENDHLL